MAKTRKSTGTFIRRLIGGCVLMVMLVMLYSIANTVDSFTTVRYYAANMPTIIHNARIALKARYFHPYYKHVDQNYEAPQEIESCIAVHKINKTFIEQQEEIQKIRKVALHDACARYYNNNNRSRGPRKAYVLDDYQLVYVESSKIASTSWNRVLLVLSHLANATNSYSQPKTSDRAKVNVPTLKNYPQGERKTVLQNFTTFMFSRHPFSRLLSAYNNKIGPDATKSHLKRGFFDLLRQNILKKFPTTIHSKGKGIPDFRGFVSYILDYDYFRDPHWKENYKVVAPCDIPYDVIGRFETLQDDAKYILQSVGADCFVEFPSSNNGSSPTNSSHDDILIEYYQTLSKPLIQRLYDRYRLDFLLFGYTFEINIGGELLRFPPIDYIV